MPPHRNQISIQLKNLYNQQFQILKDELREADYIGLTLDFWSNRSCVSYLCITGHWYKEQMDFNSKIIHFATFNERHTAVNIARCIKKILIDLEIYDKITAITCDGGENLVAACKKLDGIIKRIWCCTHRLHLVVVNALGIWNLEKKADANQISNSSTERQTTTETSTSTERQIINEASTSTERQTTTERSASTEIATSIITTSNVISKNNEENMDTTWLDEHEPGKIFTS